MGVSLIHLVNSAVEERVTRAAGRGLKIGMDAISAAHSGQSHLVQAVVGAGG